MAGKVDDQLQEECRTGALDITSQGETPDANANEENYEDEKWYHVDVDILPAKFCYFFDLARKFSTNITMILFLTQIGLDQQEAGLILGFRFVTRTFPSIF